MAFENPLVLEHSFALNKSYTKQMSVGLKVNNNYTPVVQLYGLQRYRIIEFTPQDWELFSPHIDWMVQYCERSIEPSYFQPIKCGNVSVHFTTLQNVEHVIIRRNEDQLFMRSVSLKHLKKKVVWINNYLKYLQTIPVAGHVTSIVETTAKILNRNLYKGSTNRDYRDMETYISNNFYDIYLECENVFVYTRARLQHQMFYKFFMEMTENYFDELYKLICKALSQYIRTPTTTMPNFYNENEGEDTVN